MLSTTHLLIFLAIAVLIFGTSRLRSAGSDLGSAVKNFKDAMKDGEAETAAKKQEQLSKDVKSQTGSDVPSQSQNKV